MFTLIFTSIVYSKSSNSEDQFNIEKFEDQVIMAVNSLSGSDSDWDFNFNPTVMRLVDLRDRYLYLYRYYTPNATDEEFEQMKAIVYGRESDGEKRLNAYELEYNFTIADCDFWLSGSVFKSYEWQSSFSGYLSREAIRKDSKYKETYSYGIDAGTMKCDDGKIKNLYQFKNYQRRH